MNNFNQYQIQSIDQMDNLLRFEYIYNSLHSRVTDEISCNLHVRSLLIFEVE
jgi:hypothetical protein